MSTPNPNQLLAQEITKLLIEKGLIDKLAEKKISQAIAQGTIKESDWKVYLEEMIYKRPTASSDETK
jgi:hypothetical protein